MELEIKNSEDYKIGYSSSIAFINYESQLIWRVFSNLLAANTFITGFNVAFIKLFGNMNWIILITSIFGMILCFIWYTMTKRMFAYYGYWFTWAREYEKKINPPKYQFLNIGKEYGGGNKVYIGDECLTMSGISRIVTNKRLINIVIAIISSIYLVTFIYIIYTYLR